MCVQLPMTMTSEEGVDETGGVPFQSGTESPLFRLRASLERGKKIKSVSFQFSLTPFHPIFSLSYCRLILSFTLVCSNSNVLHLFHFFWSLYIFTTYIFRSLLSSGHILFTSCFAHLSSSSLHVHSRPLDVVYSRYTTDKLLLFLRNPWAATGERGGAQLGAELRSHTTAGIRHRLEELLEGEKKVNHKS